MKLRDILHNILLEENRIDFLRSKYVGGKYATIKEFEAIEAADPTSEKKYIQILIKWLISTKKETRDPIIKKEREILYRLFFADLNTKTRNNLELFNRNSDKFPNKDINRYPSFEEFNSIAASVQDRLSDIELKKGLSKGEKYDQFKIGETTSFNIYKLPKGRTDLLEVSKYLGSGAEWCTKGSDKFADYIGMGDLYIFIRKDGKEKYQFSEPEIELADKDDNQLLIRDIPDFKQIVSENEFYNLVKNIPSVTKLCHEFIKSQNERAKTDPTHKNITHEFNSLLLELLDEDCYLDILNAVNTKFGKEIEVAKNTPIIEIREPEIYHYCVNNLGIDMKALMYEAEDISNDMYYNEYYDESMGEFIQNCLGHSIPKLVLPQINMSEKDYHYNGYKFVKGNEA
jgi:hypothetical protein